MLPRLRQAPDLVQHELDGQYLVLRVGSTDVLHLSEVASRFWELLSGSDDAEEALGALSLTYDVPVARLRGDLEPVVDLLLAQGVLVTPT